MVKVWPPCLSVAGSFTFCGVGMNASATAPSIRMWVDQLVARGRRRLLDQGAAHIELAGAAEGLSLRL
jgi:hypothetical protein